MAFEERFKLRLPLGEGELGAVWDAEDQKLGTAVAVALLEEDAPAEVRARFLEAAQVLKPLDHPGIVRVLDYGENDAGAAFMAMELIRGQTLLERLGEGPPLRIEQLVTMTIDLLEGLEKVHAAGHVHGDVEPGNFVLVEDGTGIRLKLIGFGLNRAEMRGGKVDESQDGAESALRSFACMSPEQARKEVVADVRSDVYGLGAVLYDALTGQLPYRGTTLADIRKAVATGGAKPVHEVRSELAGALAGAVDRAMSHKPMRRFADATAMRKALRAALIMSPKVKGLDVQIAPRKLDRDSTVHEALPEIDAASQEPSAPAPSEVEPSIKSTTPGGAEAPVPFEPAVEAAAPEPEAPPSTPAASPQGPGGQPRVRGPKKTMLGVPPPAAAMPAPAAKLSGLKKPAPASPKPDPKFAKAFSDEATQELSIDDFSMVDTGKAKAPPPAPGDPFSTLKSPAVPPPPPTEEAPAEATEDAAEAEAAEAPAPPEVMPPAPAPGTPAVAAAPPEITSQAIADATLDSGLVSLPATSGGPSRKLYIGGGIAAAAILLIVIISSGGDDTEGAAVEAAAPPQSERAEPEAEEAQPEPEPATEPEPEPEPESVTLALTGVPEGATVTLDGEPVDGDSIEVPRGEARHELRVTAEGYEPFSRTISAAEDAEVAVEMDEIEEPEPEPEPPAVAERPSRPQVQKRPPRRTTQRRTTSRTTSMRPSVVRDPGF